MQTTNTPSTTTPTKTTTLREKVFDYIKSTGEAGATDEEIQEFLGLEGNTARPRRWELSNKLGRVRAAGTRNTHAGRTATVWIANAFPLVRPQKATQPKQVTVTHRRNGKSIREFKSFIQQSGNSQTITFPQAIAILSGDTVSIS